MILEFAKYTEVTTRAREIDEVVYKQYEKVFVCPDVHNFWIIKILIGYNEEYIEDDDKVLIERNKINEVSAKHLDNSSDLALSNDELIDFVLKTDAEDGSNWDVLECDSIDDAISHIDGGYGLVKDETNT